MNQARERRRKDGWTVRIIWGLVLLVAGLVFVAGFWSPAAAQDDPVTIGVAVDRTGPFAWYGEKTLQAARLAVERANENGGIDGRPIELEVRNTQSDPERSITIARELSRDGVAAIIGYGLTDTTKAVAPFIERNEGPLFYTTCGACNPEHRYMFTGAVPSSLVSRRIVEQFTDRGRDRIALLTTNTAYGQGAVDITEQLVDELDFDLVATEIFEPGASDVTSQLLNIREQDPDLIYAYVIGKPMGIVLSNYHDLEMSTPLATIHANLAPQFLDSLQQFQPEEFYLAASRDQIWEDLPDDDPTKESNREFHNAFEESYGEEWPGLGGGSGWDLANIVIRAMRESGTNTDDMIRAIEGMNEYTGVVGTYNFSEDDHRGLALDDVRLIQVIDGELRLAE